jgi:hypothetical protein
VEKYQSVQAPTAGGPLPQADERRASYVPTWHANVLVPLGQAMRGGALLALALLIVGGVLLMWVGWADDWRAWVTLAGLGVLLLLVVTWRDLPERQRINDATILAYRELREGRDLDGDGEIGNGLVRNRNRDKGPNAAAQEKAVMLRFVRTLYEQGTTYNALRAAGFGTDAEIRRRLEFLARPEWGIVKLVKRGRRETVELPLPQPTAERIIEGAIPRAA